MIPKIIHQTWKSSNLPEKFQAYQKTWIMYHPQWEYRFYDDAACRAFVQREFPDLLVLYDGCPYPVQRADIFRYLVVASNGGIYADIDMECYKNMESLFAGRECVFGVETILSPRQRRSLNHVYAERIANCIFAASRKHPIFDKIIEEVVMRLDKVPEGIVETTGPGMLTDVVQKYRKRYDLRILPQIYWLTPTGNDYPNHFPFNLHMYAKHHFAGTWKNENEKLKASCLNSRLRGNRFIVLIRNVAKFFFIIFNIRGFCYKMMMSPVWTGNFYFWRKNTSRKKGNDSI
jgi:mannosyltransferase OCH1-like enzyme